MSSQCSSDFLTEVDSDRPYSEASASDGFRASGTSSLGVEHGPTSNIPGYALRVNDRQLSQARQHMNKSLEALQSQLRSGAVGGSRYASWQPGLEVEVLTPVGGFANPAAGVQPAKLVRFIAASHAMEVQFEDGSMRVVPVQLVRKPPSAASPGGGSPDGGSPQARTFANRPPSPELLA